MFEIKLRISQPKNSSKISSVDYNDRLFAYSKENKSNQFYCARMSVEETKNVVATEYCMCFTTQLYIAK